MSERPLFRVGSMSAIVGAVLGVVVNLLHPRTSEIGNVEALLREIADSGIWVGDHIGILFAVLLVTGGLAALYRSIPDQPGAAWARLGFVSALLGAAVIAILVGTDGIAAKGLATAWANAPESEKIAAFRVAAAVALINIAIFSVFIIVFFGVTFFLFGLALLTSNVYPQWLGWVALLGGLASALVGLIQAYNGPSVLVTNVLFPIFSVLLSLWVLLVGVLLGRKATAA